MRYAFINNFEQILAQAVADTDTTITLDGGGSQMSDASADLVYVLTLFHVDSNGNETAREIVHVVGASGDTLTVERAKEGTTAQAWAVGDGASQRLTAGSINGAYAAASAAQDTADTAQAAAVAAQDTADTAQSAAVAAQDAAVAAQDAADTAQATAASKDRVVYDIGSLDLTGTTSTAEMTVPSGLLFIDGVDVVTTDYQGADFLDSVVGGTPTLSGNGEGVAFSPDGSLMAVGLAEAPYLTVIDTSDWSVVPGTPSLSSTCWAVAFSPDGSYLAAVEYSSPRLHIINTNDWSVVSGISTPTSDSRGLAFSDDGAYLAVCHWDSPYLTVYATSDWSVVAGTPTLPGSGYGRPSFSPGGGLLSVPHLSSPYLSVYNTSDWSVVAGPPAMPSTGHASAFSHDGALLAVAHGWSPYLTVLNTSDWSVVPGTPEVQGYDVEFTQDDSHLVVVGAASPYVAAIDTSDWSVTQTGVAIPTSTESNGAAISPDKTLVAVAHNDSPYVTVVNVGSDADASIQLGTDETEPGNILSPSQVTGRNLGDRDAFVPVGVHGVAAVRASVSAPGGSPTHAARVIVRGYVMEL